MQEHSYHHNFIPFKILLVALNIMKAISSSRENGSDASSHRRRHALLVWVYTLRATEASLFCQRGTEKNKTAELISKCELYWRIGEQQYASQLSISIWESPSPLCKIFGRFWHTTIVSQTHQIIILSHLDRHRSAREGALHIISAGSNKLLNAWKANPTSHFRDPLMWCVFFQKPSKKKTADQLLHR